MSEMVERVARAMSEAAGFNWEACAQSQWKRDARAGIAAMREPTKAMLDPTVDLGGHDGIYQADPRAVWQAMIDEALK